MISHSPTNAARLQEDFEDFFETSLCGFVTADTNGYIIRANKRIADWVHSSADKLTGQRFSDLLTIGGKIYYETHLGPLLRMQGFFDEVVLELSSATGEKLRVLVNALERLDKDGQPAWIRYTVVKATDRLQYEQNLMHSIKTAEDELTKQKELVKLREQLIAVLGHDLRNPLSSVMMAVELLGLSVTNEDDAKLLATLKRSSTRMTELVNNIMDFARTRLGENIILKRQDVLLEPVLTQVVAEMQLTHPKTKIITVFEVNTKVNCDPGRMAQMLSNLLANALTHGAADAPVRLHAAHRNATLQIAVINSGPPIPADVQDHLFTPFKRSASRPSQNGLGLGLYICHEIARAHGALLTFTTSPAETCFTFQMKTSHPASPPSA